MNMLAMRATLNTSPTTARTIVSRIPRSTVLSLSTSARILHNDIQRRTIFTRKEEHRPHHPPTAEIEYLYGLNPILSALKNNTRRNTSALYILDSKQALFTKQERLGTKKRLSKHDTQRKSDLLTLLNVVEQHPSSPRIHYVPRQQLDTLANQRPHNGFLLAVSSVEIPKIQGVKYKSIHKSSTNEENPNEYAVVVHHRRMKLSPLGYLRNNRRKYPLILLLDSITDPQNLGSILRTSYFFNVDGVIVTKGSVPLNPVVAKASAGALDGLLTPTTRHGEQNVNAKRGGVGRIWTVEGSLIDFLRDAKEEGFDVLGTGIPLVSEESSSPDISTTHSLEPITKPTILILGSEGSGVRDTLLQECTKILYIPSGVFPTDKVETEGSIDSLNVGVTAGIVCYALSQ